MPDCGRDLLAALRFGGAADETLGSLVLRSLLRVDARGENIGVLPVLQRISCTEHAFWRQQGRRRTFDDAVAVRPSRWESIFPNSSPQ
jgi:hypothetical protein